MAGVLESLARGLRQAGGVLSPDVQKQLAGEDAQDNAERRQVEMLRLQQRLQQETPEYQARMEALKNEKLFREAATNAGGDVTKIAAAAVQYGKPELAVNLFNQQEARAARVQQDADALEARKLQLQQGHELALQRIQDGQQRQAEIERHNKAMETLNAQSVQARSESASLGNQLKVLQLELNRDRLGAERLRNVDKQVTAFANDLQQNKLPNLSASISSLNSVLGKYEGKDDIPGVGVIEGSKLIPGFVRSREAANVKSALQAVSNDLLNLYSGLAVTLPEFERRELEMMANGSFTEANFKDAWQRTVNRYNSVVGNLRASQNQDVLKEYQSRPGAMRLDPLTPAFSKEVKDKGAPPPPDGFKVDTP
jgi:hypothetical protein